MEVHPYWRVAGGLPQKDFPPTLLGFKHPLYAELCPSRSHTPSPREFLFPDSSSGQRSFWPILVEIWWVWFLGATVPVDLGTTLPKTHFQEQARKRELRPPKQEAGTSMSRILIVIHRKEDIFNLLNFAMELTHDTYSTV